VQRCAALGTSHRSLMALLIFWSTFRIQKGSTLGNMQRFADPLAHLRQHFQSGPPRLALTTSQGVYFPPNRRRSVVFQRTWLLGHWVFSGTNRNAPFCSREWYKSKKRMDSGSKPRLQEASGAVTVKGPGRCSNLVKKMLTQFLRSKLRENLLEKLALFAKF